MPSDSIEELLKSDFDALAKQLDRDRFAQRLLFKLGARQRARLGIVAFAGGLGAAFAASQFMGVVNSIAPSLVQSAPELATSGQTPQMLATFLLAGALAMTALVMRQDA
ncbi:hypothetical protein [Hyphococcus sp.]|uniref:hypothetical protein n=1 Tax=Hyphococcus sp. TaxID=2038636 RepID=UPI0020876B38|nr:MAG: hypothetical protein DHS20C04_16710 [Marinicaulis sp.]